MPALGLAVVVAVVCLGALAVAWAGLKRAPAGAAPDGPRPPLAVLGLLALAGLLLTLPSAPPFAAGMHLGIGFVLGLAVAAAGLLVLAWRPAVTGPAVLHLATVLLGIVTVALLGVAVALPGYADNAILGVALGAVVGLIVGRAALGGRAALESRAPTADWFATFCVVLCGAQFLAVHHFFSSGMIAQLAPLTVSAAMLVGLLVGALLVPQGKSAPVVITTAVGVAAVLAQVAAMALAAAGRAALLPPRLGELQHAGLVVFTGGVVAALLLAVLAAARRAAPARAGAPVLVAGLVVMLLALGFRTMAGWGLALALLPLALATVGAQLADPDGPTRRATTAALQVGAMVLLWRVLLERVGLNEHPEVDQFYLIIGLLVGLAAPLLAAEWAGGRARAGLLAVGVIVPAVVFVLWDFKALGGMSWGLVAGAFFVLWLEVRLAGTTESDPPWRGAGMVALLMGLVAAQCAPLLAPLTDLTRPAKLGLLVALLLIYAVVAVVQHLAAGALAAPGGEPDGE